jgi:anti-anti-sigma factor
MEFLVEQEHGRVAITVLRPEGNIDSSTYEAFQAKARELIEAGARYILIDMTRVPYVSSAGLRALHNIFNQLRALHPEDGGAEEDVIKGIKAGTYKSPHLKIFNFTKEARAAFDMGGFDMYIETFNDRHAAVAAF